jgi:hypothetical protein
MIKGGGGDVAEKILASVTDFIINMVDSRKLTYGYGDKDYYLHTLLDAYKKFVVSLAEELSYLGSTLSEAIMKTIVTFFSSIIQFIGIGLEATGVGAVVGAPMTITNTILKNLFIYGISLGTFVMAFVIYGYVFAYLVLPYIYAYLGVMAVKAAIILFIMLTPYFLFILTFFMDYIKFFIGKILRLGVGGVKLYLGTLIMIFTAIFIGAVFFSIISSIPDLLGLLHPDDGDDGDDGDGDGDDGDEEEETPVSG